MKVDSRKYVASYIYIYIYMKVDSGELRHFCDDPACPDPVWKL